MIFSKTYTLLPKATVLTRPELFGVQILAVMREGLGLRVATWAFTPPIDREAQHSPLTGKLRFKQPASGPGGDNEKVTIIYKT